MALGSRVIPSGMIGPVPCQDIIRFASSALQLIPLKVNWYSMRGSLPGQWFEKTATAGYSYRLLPIGDLNGRYQSSHFVTYTMTIESALVSPWGLSQYAFLLE
ncbi:hypothetical protein TMatcc_007218 [Talaromyces marneffei ATCC 18224]